MLIGILSDSHGRTKPVRMTMELFHGLGVEHVVHCGDVGGEAVFDELVGVPCTFVWGNCDLPDPGLIAYLNTVGIPPPEDAPTLLTLGAKRFAVFHGHERGFRRAPYTLEVDYILHGHTHSPSDETINGTRIINPGALHRIRPKTVATLETSTDKLTLHRIGGG